MMICIMTLSKWLWNHKPQVSCSAANFDNVMTKFIFNKRTDAQKTDVNFFFTVARPQSGQMQGINVGKIRRKLAVNKAK